ncbi:YnbE family lipoprotein [Sphingomonas qilianensis]|uniref:YnbE family lipoprotein n=1 Tax=Sphingomonas qilianensis TaxID=1736690 RepID=A0ABU9XPZ9_9SPHN
MTLTVTWRRCLTAALGATAIAASSGCVSISAPDKPIEINLNINVKQEVVYRLDGEAKSTIKANPGIF